jgi:hypothetical protein
MAQSLYMQVMPLNDKRLMIRICDWLDESPASVCSVVADDRRGTFVDGEEYRAFSFDFFPS